MSEAKAGLKARVEAELAAAADDKELEVLRDRFAAEERAIEHSIDHTVHQFSAALEVCPLHTHIDHHEPQTNPCLLDRRWSTTSCRSRFEAIFASLRS